MPAVPVMKFSVGVTVTVRAAEMVAVPLVVVATERMLQGTAGRDFNIVHEQADDGQSVFSVTE